MVLHPRRMATAVNPRAGTIAKGAGGQREAGGEDLAHQCEAARRWEFLFAAAPLRLTRGTGSPLNPIAIF